MIVINKKLNIEKHIYEERIQSVNVMDSGNKEYPWEYQVWQITIMHTFLAKKKKVPRGAIFDDIIELFTFPIKPDM